MSTIIEKLLPSKQPNRGRAVSLLTVDPGVASELLQLNERNRSLNEQRVYSYARMMERGEWEEAEADICIDWDGVLINGQHCLHAVVKSGKTIEVTLKTGMSPKSQDTMDSHRARSVADQLGIDGVHNATTVAGSAVAIMRWRELGALPTFTRGGAANHWALDRLTHLKYCRDHVDELSASATMAKTRNKKTGLLSSTQIAVLQVVFADYAPEHAAEWFAQLFGETDSCAQPVRFYRQRLVQMKGSKNEWSSSLKYAFAVKSFNAFMAQREIKKFSIRPGEKVAVNVPEGVN